MLEDCFWKHFATISKIFWRLLMISKDLKKCWKVVFSTLRHLPNFSEDFQRFLKTSEDFWKFSIENIYKISEACWNVCFFALSGSFLRFPKNFETFNKGDTNPYFL